jgi:nitrile hydratase
MTERNHETDHEHDHRTDREHGIDHEHDRGDELEPDDPTVRARALQSLLVEKGLVTTEAVDEAIAAYERDIGPMAGAKIVARAWTDESFRASLLSDARGAIEGGGFNLDGSAGLQHLEVVENTDAVHNVVVCTLCSCYPWSILGLPPTWYKSEAYRSRVVREPRSVLAEFGLELDDDVEVRVWDSTSEVRYLVLPRRPPDTEDQSESELASLVSRDAMIGVATVDPPEADR